MVPLWLFLGLALVALAFPAGIIVWARWLAPRPGVPRFVRAIPPGVLTLGVLTFAFPVYEILSAIPMQDPSEKATLLAKGISEAMNCYVYFLLVLLALGLVLGWISFGQRRASRG